MKKWCWQNLGKIKRLVQKLWQKSHQKDFLGAVLKPGQSPGSSVNRIFNHSPGSDNWNCLIPISRYLNTLIYLTNYLGLTFQQRAPWSFTWWFCSPCFAWPLPVQQTWVNDKNVSKGTKSAREIQIAATQSIMNARKGISVKKEVPRISQEFGIPKNAYPRNIARTFETRTFDTRNILRRQWFLDPATAKRNQKKTAQNFN